MAIDYSELSEIYRDAFNEFPVISGIFDKHGNEYILRKHTEADVVDYYTFYNTNGIKEFLPDGLVFKNHDEARDELNYRVNNFYKRNIIYWCIAEKSTNKLVGGCGFIDWSKYNRRLEFAYDLTPANQNKGIITSAIPRIIAFGFLHMHSVRLQATTTTDNDKSIYMLKQKFYFTHEGILKNYKYWKEEYIDVNIFSITLQDFVKFAREGRYNFLTKEDMVKAESLLQNLFPKL
jgi:ribosomal-protein-alanine N-acetyltransferase